MADLIAEGQAAAPAADGSLTRRLTDALLLADHRGCVPVGVKEIADRAGTTRKGVDTWRERYGPGHPAAFPPHRWTVGGRPAWDWGDIHAWGVATGRVRSNGQWARPGEMVAP